MYKYEILVLHASSMMQLSYTVIASLNANLTLTRDTAPPGPGTLQYEHRKAFADLVLPVNNLLDSGGNIKPTAQTYAVQRQLWDALFHWDIMNDKRIDVNCNMDADEEEVKKRYKTNCPTALMALARDV